MPKGKRDTSGLKVISRDRDCYNGKQTTYLYSITGGDTVERTNYLIEFVYTNNVPEQKDKWTGKVWEEAHAKGEYEYTRRTDTRQKLLCVGGPLAGTRSTSATGYHAYNVSAFQRGRREHNQHRCIWIHESLLKG